MTPGAVAGLSESDVREVRAEVAAGRPVGVWFTAAAVGVPAGRSAKVVAVGDIAEGEFLQVRPAGSKDTVSCSADELTRARPPRRPREAAARESVAPGPGASGASSGLGRITRGAPRGRRSGAGADTRPEEPARVVAEGAPGPPAAQEDGLAPSSGRRQGRSPAGAPPADSGASGAVRPRRGSPSAGLTVTLTAGAEGEWTVEVRAGAKRVVPTTPVPASGVAAAARALPPAVGEAVAASLEHARRQQQERVARLRAELEAAQRALDEFPA